MNKYDERYDIRMAKYNDIPAIMRFIDEHWRKNHVMAVNRELFEYEFLNSDNSVNMVLAIDKTTKEIEGFYGILNASSNPEKRDVWGSFWKVRDDHPNMLFLGVELIKRINNFLSIRNTISVGANPKTAIPVLKMVFKYETGKLNHYYRLSDRKDYFVAKISNKQRQSLPQLDNTIQVKCININNADQLEKFFDFTKIENVIPYKDFHYFKKRFCDYPFLNYKIFGVYDNSNNKMFYISREQECNGVKILRILDVVGDYNLFAGLYNHFAELLNDYEYIDFYCAGMNEEFINKAGFIKREDNDKNIIPNYFSPFVQENVDIWYYSSSKDCVYFKGDGDQDRPN